jgi:glycosyltransferase involved in cell wall biosynthesis
LDEKRMTTVTRQNALHDKAIRRLYLRTGIAPKFMRRIEAANPALMHAHFATDASIALPIRRRLNIPLIVTLHGYDVTSNSAALRKSPSGRAYLRRREQLWEETSMFLCVAEHIRQKAIERNFPEHKLCVHSIGVDLKTLKPGPASAREPIVLFVGRLVEKKGCAHLLRTMTLVERMVPDANLVILGDGPLRPELERQAQSTLSRYEFLGAQPAQVVRGWMQRARVLAAPSVIAASGDAEGLPIVLCEAQAMELPVVAFRGFGVSEAVSDGESGILVKQRDEHAMAHAILSLLQDDILAERMGHLGRQRAEKYFDLAVQTQLLEEKYTEVLHWRRSRSDSALPHSG